MRYILVRQDDNGIKYIVDEYDSEIEAERNLHLLEDFRFKPHKMTYWIESVDNLI